MKILLGIFVLTILTNHKSGNLEAKKQIGLEKNFPFIPKNIKNCFLIIMNKKEKN